MSITTTTLLPPHCTLPANSPRLSLSYRLFHAEVWGEERTWHAVLGDMFGPRYLGATVMGAFCTFVTAWLTYLLLDQLANIARNVTTNERMNWKRCVVATDASCCCCCCCCD